MRHLVLILSLLCFAGRGWATDVQYFAAPPEALAQAKVRLAAHDAALQPALSALIQAANQALQATPPSVMEKSKTPPSGDKHDYLSVAPYWWPDTRNPDGLPYVRHDGKVNPESRDQDFDRARLGAMARDVETLALAYYFTGQADYAEKAADFLRVWFLNPATRMNPNLEFAQAVPGRNTGRGTGILEGRNISQAADAAGLLAASPAWTKSDQAALNRWLQTYLDWLLTSAHGCAEAAAQNNHGTWYDVQVMELALVLGKEDLARQVALAAETNRLARQIEPDGRQPQELKRTKALSYSAFNLEAWFTLATLARHAGVDLWHCPLANGRAALRTALDFLLPYLADPNKKWPYQQIKTFHADTLATELRQAAIVYQAPPYEKILESFSGVAGNRLQLLEPVSQTLLDVGEMDRERILKSATAALALAPITITAYHPKFSEGGPHDYYSNGDYWWPDPTKPDGLPYIRRDGLSNPNNFDQDRLALRRLRDAVAALGAAYKLTGEDRYAAKAAALLRVFLLDPATRMNPNLKYAQAIPGVCSGRGIGIIDTLHLIEIPKAVEAMEPSSAFSPEVLGGLKQWFRDYTDWMLTSANGQDEAKTKNNHAVAFWLQVAVFAQFTGDTNRLAQCRREYQEVFLPQQMALNGSFPLELARTKPYGYSIFQLDNLATLCQVLSTPADNLWQYELPDGRGIRQAVAYLYPFLKDKSKWPLKPDVQAWNGWPVRQVALLFAGLACDDRQYLGLWKTLPADPTSEEVCRNIAISQPVLWIK